MKVTVVYARPGQVLQLPCRVADDATVADAINDSGLAACCPELDLKVQKVGVFGKLVKLDAALKEGDRVEIYQRITRVLDDDDDDDDED